MLVSICKDVVLETYFGIDCFFKGVFFPCSKAVVEKDKVKLFANGPHGQSHIISSHNTLCIFQPLTCLVHSSALALCIFQYFVHI